MASLDSAKTDNKKSFEKLMKKNSNKMLGDLIKLFDRYVDDDALTDRLKKAKKHRNFLAHDILPEYGWPIMSEENYLKAIGDIAERTNYIFETGRMLDLYISTQNISSLHLAVIQINPNTGEFELDDLS